VVEAVGVAFEPTKELFKEIEHYLCPTTCSKTRQNSKGAPNLFVDSEVMAINKNIYRINS